MTSPSLGASPLASPLGASPLASSLGGSPLASSLGGSSFFFLCLESLEWSKVNNLRFFFYIERTTSEREKNNMTKISIFIKIIIINYNFQTSFPVT